jgi:putative transposase
MRRRGVIAIDEYYHVYNRGVDKHVIFNDSSDYHRFLMLLYLCNDTSPVNLEEHFRKGRGFTEVFDIQRSEPIVAIGSWCLMLNHFHLLCKEITEGGLQRFMRKLSTGYSMYFNTKHQRTGTLFEGRFKAQHIDSDCYLRYMYSYIYLNPVKLVAGEGSWKEIGIQDKEAVVSFLEHYPYISGKKSADNKIFDGIVSPKYFPKYHGDIDEMEREVLSWLDLEL